MIRRRAWRRALAAAGTTLTLLLAGPMLMLASPRVDLDSHWATVDRAPARLAPDPDRIRDAVVQVYAARAFNWRGAFAVHTWIATKTANAPYYQVHEVTRWYRSATATRRQSPDRAWYGSAPWLLADYRGEAAARMIPGIIAAVADYPGAMEYDVWPGPNSNTFVAWVVRRVPELRVHLPAIAVGKDYLPEGVLARAPSGSGYQLSLGGVFGWLVALEEGIELNLLGLTLGIDLTYPALKLPGIGRVGFAEPAMGNGAAR